MTEDGGEKMVQSSTGGVWTSCDFLLSLRPCGGKMGKQMLGADSSPTRLRAEGGSWEDSEVSGAEQRSKVGGRSVVGIVNHGSRGRSPCLQACTPDRRLGMRGRVLCRAGRGAPWGPRGLVRPWPATDPEPCGISWSCSQREWKHPLCF